MPASLSPWPAGDKQPEEVETSPNGRYIRYNILLGKGACKRVYKALDTNEGREVAWNQVELLGMDRDEEARQHLQEEIRVLQKLKHKNIITFYAWWYDSSNLHINFITELFTAGNLRQYRKKLKMMSENVLKRWAHQILEGLLYLHGHTPPIVHRDLKCDNIFVNSATGEVKIGDLGLATVQQTAMSVVGTPEFMAPEVYDESYDERCDIYSFGMCLLELATLEYPYSECHSVPQIFKKVTLGIPPASLARVGSPELRDFIALCIAHNPTDRPTARELLKHPYLEAVRTSTTGITPCESFNSLAGAGGSGSSSGFPVLAAPVGSCPGGGNSGWNTPSGTLHCAASVRDLREALHQQETLARHLLQHQQSHSNSQQMLPHCHSHGHNLHHHNHHGHAHHHHHQQDNEQQQSRLSASGAQLPLQSNCNCAAVAASSSAADPHHRHDQTSAAPPLLATTRSLGAPSVFPTPTSLPPLLVRCASMAGATMGAPSPLSRCCLSPRSPTEEPSAASPSTALTAAVPAGTGTGHPAPPGISIVASMGVSLDPASSPRPSQLSPLRRSGNAVAAAAAAAATANGNGSGGASASGGYSSSTSGEPSPTSLDGQASGDGRGIASGGSGRGRSSLRVLQSVDSSLGGASSFKRLLGPLDSITDDSDEEVVVPIEVLKAGLLREGFVDTEASSPAASLVPGMFSEPSEAGSDPSALSLVDPRLVAGGLLPRSSSCEAAQNVHHGTTMAHETHGSAGELQGGGSAAPDVGACGQRRQPRRQRRAQRRGVERRVQLLMSGGASGDSGGCCEPIREGDGDGGEEGEGREDGGRQRSAAGLVDGRDMEKGGDVADGEEEHEVGEGEDGEADEEDAGAEEEEAEEADLAVIPSLDLNPMSQLQRLARAREAVAAAASDTSAAAAAAAAPRSEADLDPPLLACSACSAANGMAHRLGHQGGSADSSSGSITASFALPAGAADAGSVDAVVGTSAFAYAAAYGSNGGRHGRTGSAEALTFNLSAIPAGASGTSTPALRMSSCEVSYTAMTATAPPPPTGPSMAEPQPQGPHPLPLQLVHPLLPAGMCHTPPHHLLVRSVSTGEGGSLPLLPLPPSEPPAHHLLGLHSVHSSPGNGPLVGRANVVRLPSFRNKVLLTLAQLPPGDAAGAAAGGGGDNGSASDGGAPTRYLRTTSARSIGGVARLYDTPSFSSPSDPVAGGGIRNRGGTNLPVRPFSVAAAAVAASGVHPGAGGARSLPLQALEAVPEGDGSGTVVGSSGIPPLMAAAGVAGSRSNDTAGGSSAAGGLDNTTALAVAAASSSSVDQAEESVIIVKDLLSDSEQLVAMVMHASAAPPSVPVPPLTTLGPVPVIPVGNTALSRCSAPVICTATPASPFSASPPLPAPAAICARASEGGRSLATATGVTTSLPVRTEGARGHHAAAQKPSAAPHEDLTVLREFARPIQGVIMRLKQFKRLVKDRAKALRS